ncbi:MAG TPA: acyl-CoA dehydrogenase family protein, partial [Noviherbaspirillum sp.]
MAIDFSRSWMNEELEMVRDTAIRFIESEMAPHDEQARKEGHVGRAIWRKAGEIGLLCSDIPEQYGGGGGDFRHEAVFYEEMARRGLTGMNASVHSIVAHYLLNHGTEGQKARYLPGMARGELIGAIAMTEPDAGSDLQGVRTRAERRAEGYVIN